MAVDDHAPHQLRAEPLSAVKARIRDGDLLLCSGSQPMSKLIRAATHSPWSHVALIYRWPAIGRIMVFESVERIGVRTVPLEDFLFRSGSKRKPYPGPVILARHADYAESASAPRTKALADFAVDRFGAPFAPGEILKIGARIIAGGMGVTLPRTLGPKDEFICSEYVAKCYEQVGIDIPWDQKGFIAPADFARDPKIQALARVSTTPG